jgi:lipoprotein-releasing system ATP-binding protein
MQSESILTLKGISKAYTSPQGLPAPVLDGIDLAVPAGATLSVVGPSGCGKSTLLNIMGSLDRPTAGVVCVGGRSLAGLADAELARIRNAEIGFVFQLHHLLPQCTVLENVLVPTVVGKRSRADEARTRACRLLERVGLGQRLDYRPGQLSGGERQRVAVVRALINAPRLLLADEPTGSLDRRGATELCQLLIELNREEGTAIVMVTHSEALAAMMGTHVELDRGKIIAAERH